MSATFNELHLHGAVLKRLVLDWDARTLSVELSVFYSRGQDALPSILTFSGVRHVDIPRQDPRGPSVLMDRNRFTPPDLYELEAQSGDVVAIRAEAFSLTLATNRELPTAY